MFDKLKQSLGSIASMPTLIIAYLVSMSPQDYIALMGAITTLATSFHVIYAAFKKNAIDRKIKIEKHNLEMERYRKETELLNATKCKSDGK